MDNFWVNFSAQFWGSLVAGLILLPFAIVIEAVLDEWRDRRHEPKEREK